MEWVVGFWQQLLASQEGFLPHAVCLSFGPMLWISAISDCLIAASYYSIPLALAYFCWKRRDLVFRWIFVMFGLFILACGTTHVMHVWTLFEPDYLASSAVNLFTGVVSLATALVLWPLMPRALALPSPQMLTDANQALSREITERQEAEARVHAANLELERRVEERTAELERANLALRQEIERRSAVELELRQAKDEAEQANVGKSKFLAAASHDLRQPIQAMFYFSQALSYRLNDETGQSILVDLDRSLVALKGLLDSLLDVSKLDAGVVVAEPQVFAVHDLLERAAAEFSPSAEQKGVRLRVVKSRQRVESDPALLSRILQNLVANAVRYTDHGRILVGCRRRGKDLSIEVHDTGIGIPKDRLADIFEEFTQVESDDRERSQGLGLGLAIVHRLARLLNHRVSVRSILGRGSTFAVTVPAVFHDEKPPAERMHRGFGGGETIGRLALSDPNRYSPPSQAGIRMAK